MIIAIITNLKSRTQRTTRELLLEAAARVIARDGFQGARLADVAREAGLTTGAVYSNFRDKEELFLAAVEDIQRASETEPIETGIEGLIESFLAGEARFENSRQLQILNLEMALLGVRDARVRKILREAARETVILNAKELPGDDSERLELATQLIALANGFALMRLIAPDAYPLEAAERGLRKLAAGA